jgi:hypothetical protein
MTHVYSKGSNAGVCLNFDNKGDTNVNSMQTEAFVWEKTEFPQEKMFVFN